MSEIITLDNNSPEIQYFCKKDKRLAKVISMVGSITNETHDEDPYVFLIHKIIEQILSVKAGNKIFSRLLDLCGLAQPRPISRNTAASLWSFMKSTEYCW